MIETLNEYLMRNITDVRVREDNCSMILYTHNIDGGVMKLCLLACTLDHVDNNDEIIKYLNDFPSMYERCKVGRELEDHLHFNRGRDHAAVYTFRDDDYGTKRKPKIIRAGTVNTYPDLDFVKKRIKEDPNFFQDITYANTVSVKDWEEFCKKHMKILR